MSFDKNYRAKKIRRKICQMPQKNQVGLDVKKTQQTVSENMRFFKIFEICFLSLC